MAKKPPSKPALPTYPINPALESAVIVNAEDDTPRLVYADWLDENGDPDRAIVSVSLLSLLATHPHRARRGSTIFL
ncbi:MAG: TIGR02996 domain-containing protein [Planctomycetia bacterium]|nr:TIGR02996 domain-containing protein [Planctomycetia bacterium]